MNPCALGIISSYIWLDVPFLLHTTTFFCIELIIAAERMYSSSVFPERATIIITMQIERCPFRSETLQKQIFMRRIV